MITRRDALKTITLGTVTAAIAESMPGTTAWANIAQAAAAPAAAAPARPPAYAGTHKVKDLPYPPAKLKGLDEVMITNHHGKNYSGTVAKLNKIEQSLGDLNKDTPVFVR